MKQKSLIGLLSTVAVVVGTWACGDSCTNKGTPNKEGETNGHSQGDATIGWPFLKQFTLP